MATVTLIGERLATLGREFVFGGEASGCAGCPYRDQCLNLTEGRRYRVTEIREGGQTLDCAVHEGGVTAVEVEPAPIEATVPDIRAFAGSKTALEGECPYTGCPSHEYCEPAGADLEETYIIDEVLGDPPHEYCALDRELTLVEFAPAEEE